MVLHDGNTDACVFVPRGELAALSEYFDQTPRYLFRTFAPQSMGETTETFVSSEAAKCNGNQSDLLGRSQEKAAEMLRYHLLWGKNPNDNDNLVSWTSSFLFAIQHAIRREATDDDPAATPDSIHITILDTREVPRGTFLPAVALLQEYKIESRGKLRHDYYYGEYLSQGRLSSNMITTVSLDKLIKFGLYDLYPEFDDDSEKKRLCLRVLHLREMFKKEPAEPTDEEINIAERISDGCFPQNNIRPVMMIILLSLRRRYRLEPRILKAFQSNCWGIFISDDSLECYRTTTKYVPEHRQVAEMLHDIHASTQRERQIERSRVALNPTRHTFDLAGSLNRLRCKDIKRDFSRQ